jgi:hypothetical protein
MSPFATERLEEMGISPDARVPYMTYDLLMKILDEVNKGERSPGDVTPAMFDEATIDVDDHDRLVALAKAIKLPLDLAEEELLRCPMCTKGTCALKKMAEALIAKYPSKGVVSMADPFEVRVEAIAEVMNNERPTRDTPNEVFLGSVAEASDSQLLQIAAAARIDASIAIKRLTAIANKAPMVMARPEMKRLYDAVLRASAN